MRRGELLKRDVVLFNCSPKRHSSSCYAPQTATITLEGTIDNTMLDQATIDKRKYEGRVAFLQKTFNKIRANKQLLSECQRVPFINQVMGLSRMLPPLTDEERMKAIDAILESEVYDRVKAEEAKNKPDFDYIDQLVKELLKWYKEEFFTWVNKLGCPQCGNNDQDKINGMGGYKAYKPEHLAGKASMVEKYRCLKCGNTYEFPRYNNICTLLDSRKGRCGEWNNCFIALLRSLDISVRYIWNAEDHVWCEYYSDKQKRWIHLDSCENSYDQPLLYNSGWSKKMSYVFAIHKAYIIDVTDKYLDPKKPDLKLPKNKAPAEHLKAAIAYYNSNTILSLPKEEMFDITSELVDDLRSSKKTQGSKTLSSLQARQSGGAEWTAQRGEAGQ